MKEYIVKTIDCGLGIALDIYNNRTWEYTIPIDVYEMNPELTTIIPATMALCQNDKAAAFPLITAALNKCLEKAGLPPIAYKL